MCPDGDYSLPDPRNSTPKPRGSLNLPLPTRSPYPFRSRLSQPSPEPEDATSLISRDERRHLRLEIASLQSEISALRLRHDEELQEIRAELKTMRLATKSPQPTARSVMQPAHQSLPQLDSQTVQQPTSQPETPSQPTLEPASQPIQHPASQSVPQLALLPVPRPAQRSTQPGLNPVPKKKKKEKKKKTCSRSLCFCQQSNDLVAESLAYAVLRLNENSRSNCIHFHPPNRFPPTPKVLPVPSRNKFSPGFHPGVIPLMDVMFI